MFCDFCECEDCVNGKKLMSHAETNKGTWICDICYYYNICTKGPDKKEGPCRDNCKHRPILIGHWLKFEDLN